MSVMLKFQNCTKVCKNPGSLKRHVQLKHRNVGTVSEESVSNSVSSQLEFKCGICAKVLKSENNLVNHITKVHKGQASQTHKGLSNQSIEKLLDITDKKSEKSDNDKAVATTNVPDDTETAVLVRVLRSRRRSVSLYKGKR